VPNHFARHLRRNATDAEKKLWQELRLLNQEGRHFRRQVPIAGFIADFACYQCRLVVELDGGQHNTPEGNCATTSVLGSWKQRAFAFCGSGILTSSKILKASST